MWTCFSEKKNPNQFLISIWFIWITPCILNCWNPFKNTKLIFFDENIHGSWGSGLTLTPPPKKFSDSPPDGRAGRLEPMKFTDLPPDVRVEPSLVGTAQILAILPNKELGPTYTDGVVRPKKKDKDRRKDKSRRYCLGGRIYSIPCHASYLP